jgi:predicted HicB family RNase H-like nuclease
MLNLTAYRTFSAMSRYSEEDQLYVGRIAGIKDIVGFHGVTPQALQAAFEEAVDDYLEVLERQGRPVANISKEATVRGC